MGSARGGCGVSAELPLPRRQKLEELERQGKAQKSVLEEKYKQLEEAKAMVAHYFGGYLDPPKLLSSAHTTGSSTSHVSPTSSADASAARSWLLALFSSASSFASRCRSRHGFASFSLFAYIFFLLFSSFPAYHFTIAHSHG